ncbi:MAG TPA: hypothetical protein VKB96_08360 [Gammaproteobacteria bacterium]|nr:hypothetical protein [Gammaproteobacteria bacterium]
MSSPDEPDKATLNRELRRHRWLKRIEQLVPKMLLMAEKKGDIVVANLGQKRLPDGRIVKFTLEAKIVHQGAGGAHKGH